ncbi:hypothetical protein NXH64_07485 [Butyrivibrio fibrisolvens]|uniref:hypothetical protein n=1 Tax=Pseudobutyrivibrio ruminis TaxID=46206 RepID=UPI00040D5DFB|nr:hypothetical protein [Pseudobutyrivibrio ruminis]MDC7279344.1 hypothetical protein [Butyrivibrio fibrisolvens]
MKNLMMNVKNKMVEFWNEEDGIGTVEMILILVGICIADKSRILCGNFRCI